MESARADVLIETIRCCADGELPWWPWHRQRLTRSASELGFPTVPDDLRQRVADAVSKDPGAPGDTAGLRRIRLLYARTGQIDIQIFPLAAMAGPPLLGFAQDILGNAAVLDPAEPLLQHKATYRPWYGTATHWLAQHPAVFDLAFFNVRGELCEGSRSNVYVKLAGQWLTPPIEAGCLPGTLRARLLSEKQVQIATLARADLHEAEAWRLSNGLRGWFDVRLLGN